MDISVLANSRLITKLGNAFPKDMDKYVLHCTERALQSKKTGLALENSKGAPAFTKYTGDLNSAQIIWRRHVNCSSAVMKGTSVNGSQDDTEVASIASEILAYFVRHPKAEDQLSGIIQWWLFEQRISNQTEQVKAALSMLTSKHLIIKRSQTAGDPTYRMNRKQLRKAQDLLSITVPSRTAARSDSNDTPV